MDTSPANPPAASLRTRAVARTRRTFYGWWIVGASALTNSVGGSVHWQGFTVFFIPVASSLGLSNAQTALPFALARAEHGLFGPITGWLIDRFGVRPLMLGGTVMVGIGYIWLSQTSTFLSFVLVYLFVISLGASTSFMQASTTAINHWFVRKRGLAMSINSAAFRLGGAFMVPLLSVAVLTWGWERAALVVGIGMIVLIAPLALLFRRSPEGMGIGPDGDPPKPRADVESERTEAPPADPLSQRERVRVREKPLDSRLRRYTAASSANESPTVQARPNARDFGDDDDWTVRDAVRSTAFWVLALGTVLRMSAHGTFFVHVIPILVWKGETQQTAANLVGLLAAISVPLILSAGVFSDRIGRQRILFFCYGASGASLLLLNFVEGTWPLFAALGLFAGSEAGAALNWALVGDLFGRRKFATIRGLLAPLYNTALLITPVAAGWAFDETGSYSMVLYIGAGLMFAAALVFFNLRSPKRPEMRDAH